MIVLFNRKIPLRLRKRFYRTVIKPGLLCDTKYWTLKRNHTHIEDEYSRDVHS